MSNDIISNKDTHYSKKWKDDLEKLKEIVKREWEAEIEVNDRLKKLEQLDREKKNNDIMHG